MIRFGPALVSSKHVVEYSNSIFSPTQIHTLYVGLEKKAISVGSAWNNSAGANVSVVSDSTFSVLSNMTLGAITAFFSFWPHKRAVVFLGDIFSRTGFFSYYFLFTFYYLSGGH